MSAFLFLMNNPVRRLNIFQVHQLCKLHFSRVTVMEGCAKSSLTCCHLIYALNKKIIIVAFFCITDTTRCITISSWRTVRGAWWCRSPVDYLTTLIAKMVYDLLLDHGPHCKKKKHFLTACFYLNLSFKDRKHQIFFLAMGPLGPWQCKVQRQLPGW